MNRRSVPIARSIADEDRRMGCCECGGRWRLATEEIIPRSGRWYDSLVVVCKDCCRPEGYLFDITPFFVVRASVWTRHAA